jgi:hypothetical protein
LQILVPALLHSLHNVLRDILFLITTIISMLQFPKRFVSVSTCVYTWHRLQRVVAILADSTEVSLELQVRDSLICQACHRHTLHFMCLCAKHNNKNFEHKGKLGTSIHAFCRRGETRPYNGTLQTYELQTYINLAKIFHEIK